MHTQRLTGFEKTSVEIAFFSKQMFADEEFRNYLIMKVVYLNENFRVRFLNVLLGQQIMQSNK